MFGLSVRALELVICLVVIAVVGVGTAGIAEAARAADWWSVVANGLGILLAFLLPPAFDRRFPGYHAGETSLERYRDKALLFFGRAP